MIKSDKKIVALMYGGKSAEHEVSIQSARNILHAIPKDKYEVVPIFIDKSGVWYWDKDQKLNSVEDYHDLVVDQSFERVAIVPSPDGPNMYNLEHKQSLVRIDIAFSILHGTYGEDGCVQGLLKVMDIPFVGAGVLGSAIGMDKEVMKRLLREAGIKTPNFVVLRKEDKNKLKFSDIIGEIGLPFFMKPANLGSSVGIHKIKNETNFENALNDAFLYDHKVILEEFISGREIECSVLGNKDPEASIQGEIVTNPRHEFYSYEAKYLDDEGASLIIPANLPEELSLKIKTVAVQAFKALLCEGMARVDFFVTDQDVYINEINTLPGFTKISMYPKLWNESGIGYTELIEDLIELAIKRFEEDKSLRSSLN